MKQGVRFGFCLVAVVLLAILAGGCGEQQEKGQTQQAAPVQVKAVKAVRKDVEVWGEFVGQTDAFKTVEVRARIDGYLKERLFTEGAQVKEGDLLFVIDPQPYIEALKEAEATLAKNRAALAKAEKDYERFRELLEQDAVSRDEFDVKDTARKELIATVERARSSVEKARLDLGYTRISAPLDGQIGKTLVNPGALISREQTLMAIISDSDPIYVDFSISEADYLRAMRMRQKRSENGESHNVLELILADGSTYGEKGRVDMVEPKVDPTTGTLGLRAVFPNPARLLRAGQFAKVRVVIQSFEDATVIPSRAILNVQGRKSVFVVGGDGSLKSVPVTIKYEENNIAVVEEGVKPGEVVVTEGLGRLKPDMKVEADIQPFTGEVL